MLQSRTSGLRTASSSRGLLECNSRVRVRGRAHWVGSSVGQHRRQVISATMGMNTAATQDNSTQDPSSNKVSSKDSSSSSKDAASMGGDGGSNGGGRGNPKPTTNSPEPGPGGNGWRKLRSLKLTGMELGEMVFNSAGVLVVSFGAIYAAGVKWFGFYNLWLVHKGAAGDDKFLETRRVWELAFKEALKETTDTTNMKIDSLKSDFNTMKSDFNTMKSDFNTMKSDFNTKPDGLNITLMTTNARIDGLSSKVDGVSSRVNQLSWLIIGFLVGSMATILLQTTPKKKE